jgi:hypothetical protein
MLRLVSVTAHRLVREGRFPVPVVAVDGEVRVPRAELLRYVEELNEDHEGDGAAH